MTMDCGVFGFPLGHSISAIFQQAAFDSLGLDVSYHRWPVSSDDFPMRLRELRHPRFLGANVTIPHKEAALRQVDHADPVAEAAGAVNTIARRGGELHGYNTDVSGFLDILARECGESPAGESALVLGAGGAARAVGLALILAGVGRLVIANRSFERACQLRDHLGSLSVATTLELRERLASHLSPLEVLRTRSAGSFLGEGVAPRPEPTGILAKGADAQGVATDIDVVTWHGDEFYAAVECCRFVVNCTAVGMLGPQQDANPLPDDSTMHEGAVVIDIVANPLETRLIAWARAAGRHAVGGLPMLIYQGAESFAIWTGCEPPLGVMREAALEHMRRTAG